MSKLQKRKFLYFNLFLLNVINPIFFPAWGNPLFKEISKTDIQGQFNFRKNVHSSFSSENESLNKTLQVIPKLALKEYSSPKKQLEIQSDTQYQEENVINAQGNVLVTYKGNFLKADRLIYDELKEIIKAEGNIRLMLGDQIFSAEKILYDFRNKKGFFLKVKGLIKTKNFVDNLDLTSYESDETKSRLKEISRKKLLYTPDGINNWIFNTEKLIVENDQWSARKAIFTNDLLETNQVKFEINNLKIIPKQNEIKLKSSISYLIFEDNLPIPFWFGNRTLKKTNDGSFFEFSSKWYVGSDKVDKDGYFLGRKLKPINISDDFVLDLEPQFLIQRSLQGYTKSFVNKGDSVIADKSRRDVSFSDYFSLSSDLKGKINSWDLKVEKRLFSFDFDKFLDATRFKVNLSKEINFLNSKWDKSFFGVYRDRIWNGSIGESEIYIGYGSKLEKLNTWEVDGIKKTEKLSMGVGKFKGERLNSENLVSSYKGSIFYSLDQKFPLIVKESKSKFVDKSFNYVFQPVKQGIYIDTKVAALYSFYEGGNHQEYVGFGAGPEFVFGEFKSKFLDYTRLSLFPFYRLKSGDSMFKFDQVSDQLTLNIALDQQLYGPILIKTNATLNLDSNSKNYGDFINSKISLNWKKRSYQLGIFYQPHNQSGGINFSLYGFE